MMRNIRIQIGARLNPSCASTLDLNQCCVPTPPQNLFPQPALMFAVKSADAVSRLRLSPNANKKQSDAHGRRQRLKTPVNKLSCAGWLPHDRDSVSGCLVLGTSVGTWPAHNRSRGFPAVALPPAVGAWESDDSWMPSCWLDRVRFDCQTARG